MPPYRENHKKQKKKIQFIADGDHGRDDAYGEMIWY